MKPKLKSALWAVAILVIVLFALQGGEYGTTDLVRQFWSSRTLAASIDSVQHEVDSLRAYRKRLDTDPKLQERIAREQFGMVRDGEILYRFVEKPPK